MVSEMSVVKTETLTECCAGCAVIFSFNQKDIKYTLGQERPPQRKLVYKQGQDFLFKWIQASNSRKESKRERLRHTERETGVGGGGWEQSRRSKKITWGRIWALRGVI